MTNIDEYVEPFPYVQELVWASADADWQIFARIYAIDLPEPRVVRIAGDESRQQSVSPEGSLNPYLQDIPAEVSSMALGAYDDPQVWMALCEKADAANTPAFTQAAAKVRGFYGVG